jgi:hypothetical protein
MESLAAQSKATEPVAAAKKTDEFSEMLSTVVNDPAIRQPVKEPKQENKEIPVESKPAAPAPVTPVPEPAQQQTTLQKSDEQVTAQAGRRNTVRQIDASTVNQVLQLTYIDEWKGEVDTVQVLLPLTETDPAAEKKSPEPSAPEKITPDVLPVQDTSAASTGEKDKQPATAVSVEPAAVAVKEEPSARLPEPKFLPVEVKPVAAIDTATGAASVIPMINSDCREIATEEDFLKLRKKMAGAENEDDMLTAARKVFKTRCFSTGQIKNLGVLFLKDEGRYRFFDLSYPFVSDSHLFATLENQLSEPYYINRFRAMVRR